MELWVLCINEEVFILGLTLSDLLFYPAPDIAAMNQAKIQPWIATARCSRDGVVSGVGWIVSAAKPALRFPKKMWIKMHKIGGSFG